MNGKNLRIEELLRRYPASEHDYRKTLQLLVSGSVSVYEIIQQTGLPHRKLQVLLRALGEDLRQDGNEVEIKPASRSRYSEYAASLQRPSVEAVLSTPDTFVSSSFLREIDRLIQSAPDPKSELDHIQATAKTVAQRVLFLEASYELSDRCLVFLGDHDLTGLALAHRTSGDVDIRIVDVDEDLLAYVEQEARTSDLSVRCLFGDLRHALPETARACADVVVTDPPYTPEGVELFVARAVEALARDDEGRILVAYGYGDHPRLGHKVQRRIVDLSIVFEAIYPRFNRYDGAPAIGSTSDLNVLRPTTHAKERITEVEERKRIYTHGPQAVEASPRLSEDIASHLLETVPDIPDRVVLLAGEDWPSSIGHTRLHLSTILTTENPPDLPGRDETRVILVDLVDDPASLLLRTALAVQAAKLLAVVSSDHPDLSPFQGDREIGNIVASKYSIGHQIDQPDQGVAIMEMSRIDPRFLEPRSRGRRRFLERAHAKTENALRQSLIEWSVGSSSGLTKRAATKIVHEHFTTVDLSCYVLELPRVVLERVLATLDEVTRRDELLEDSSLC